MRQRRGARLRYARGSARFARSSACARARLHDRPGRCSEPCLAVPDSSQGTVRVAPMSKRKELCLGPLGTLRRESSAAPNSTLLPEHPHGAIESRTRARTSRPCGAFAPKSPARALAAPWAPAPPWAPADSDHVPERRERLTCAPAAALCAAGVALLLSACPAPSEWQVHCSCIPERWRHVSVSSVADHVAHHYCLPVAAFVLTNFWLFRSLLNLRHPDGGRAQGIELGGRHHRISEANGLDPGGAPPPATRRHPRPTVASAPVAPLPKAMPS